MTLTRTTIKIPIEYLPTTKQRLPQFLPLLTEFLHENICTEGLFRINGDKRQVLKLNEMLSQHIPQWPEGTSPHDAASFLKLWLIELPIPLIIPSVITAYGSDDIQKSTKDILFHLPLVTRKCIAVVFYILQDLLDHSDQNHMDMGNMLTCIMPALTHNFRDLPPNFSFKGFFQAAIGMLNEDKTDFTLTEKTVSLLAGGRKRSKTSIPVKMRKKIGRASLIDEGEEHSSKRDSVRNA